jgi:hypothetical protein
MTCSAPREPAAAQVAPVLAAQWRQAQDRLFGSLVMQPELYERVVLVVAATMDRLRELTPSTAALLSVQGGVVQLVVEQARAHGLDPVGVDPALVGQAALGLRHREVMAEETNRHRVEVLAVARGGEAGWVVLEEFGDPDGDPLRPYRRLEADATTGRALLVRTEPDERFEGCEHVVEAVRVDLLTGALLPAGSDPDLAPLPLADARARERRADALRRP